MFGIKRSEDDARNWTPADAIKQEKELKKIADPTRTTDLRIVLSR